MRLSNTIGAQLCKAVTSTSIVSYCMSRNTSKVFKTTVAVYADCYPCMNTMQTTSMSFWASEIEGRKLRQLQWLNADSHTHRHSHMCAPTRVGVKYTESI